MRPKNGIRVKAAVVGFLDGRSAHHEGTVQLKPEETVRGLLKRADKALGLMDHKPFRRVFRQPVEPLVLVNGRRLEPGEISKHRLSDGDEIRILVAVAGG